MEVTKDWNDDCADPICMGGACGMTDMEILHEIVAADKAARQRVEAARQEKETFDERLEELSRELKEGLMEKTRRDVEAARQQAESSAAEKLAALDEECGEAMERMRRQFAQRKAAGVDQVFRMVVGLDD